MRLAVVGLLAAMAVPASAFADQLACITREEAEAARSVVKEGDFFVGSTSCRPTFAIKIELVEDVSVGIHCEGAYSLYLNGESVDLAYTWMWRGRRWENLSRMANVKDIHGEYIEPAFCSVDDFGAPVGYLGGNCYPNSTCNAGLTCNASIKKCVAEEPPPMPPSTGEPDPTEPEDSNGDSGCSAVSATPAAPLFLIGLLAWRRRRAATRAEGRRTID